MKIRIKKSPTADTRTCDWEKVTKEQLRESTIQHIGDVQKAMFFFVYYLRNALKKHDFTKLLYLDEFFEDFQTGFKKTDWWRKHQKTERHHIKNEKYIQKDVNLLDILEKIADGVVAGLSRSGEYIEEELDPELLVRAYYNTVKLLIKNIKVVK